MTELEVRKIVVEALEHANTMGIYNSKTKETLLSGGEDIQMEKLELDSLSSMELCIALELNSDIVIVPDELAEFKTFNEFIKKVIGK